MLDSGPCQNWPPICDDFPEDPTPEQQILIDQSVQIATEVLWNRTKRRFGLCSVTIRPCKRDCWPAWPWIPAGFTDITGWGWPFPALVDGAWINIGCGVCGDDCSCTSISSVRLPYPVACVTEVKVDGEILDSSAYRVDNRRFLVRLDGLDWPRCNDLNLDDGQVGTWSVTAEYGEMVPTLGQLAVGELAGQIYKRCAGGDGCLLPTTTVRQITRQGVTKVFFDANTAFASGKVGLYYSDLFIATYNPSSSGIASIYSIDGPRRTFVGGNANQS